VLPLRGNGNADRIAVTGDQGVVIWFLRVCPYVGYIFSLAY
jgi:hypothetical protein